MASREENVKKINDELEALSDEELDKIAGGTFIEVAGDSRFLNDLNGSTNRYSASIAFFDYIEISEKVCRAWSKFGISMSADWGGNNMYFKDGKEISRNEAMHIAARACGKDFDSMNTTDYNI